MVDSTPPNNVIPLLFQKNTAPREIHAKPATDKYQEGRSLFASHPLQSLVTTWMNAPFDLYRTGVTRIIDILEMTKKPSSIQRRIITGIPYIHAVIHNSEYISRIGKSAFLLSIYCNTRPPRSGQSPRNLSTRVARAIGVSTIWWWPALPMTASCPFG